MWFFMYVCYGASLFSFLLLGIGFLQNIFSFQIAQAGSVTFMILTSIVYLFTETLIIFFFVGTGVSVKEYTMVHKLAPDFHRKSISIKRYVYPPQLLNILFCMILFFMIGAVDTGRCPLWLYLLYYVFCLWHFAKAKVIQHRAFRENTENILAMSGIQTV